MVSDIPSGDGKTANIFYSVHAKKGEVGGRADGERKLCMLKTVRWEERPRKEENLHAKEEKGKVGLGGMQRKEEISACLKGRVRCKERL